MGAVLFHSDGRGPGVAVHLHCSLAPLPGEDAAVGCRLDTNSVDGNTVVPVEVCGERVVLAAAFECDDVIRRAHVSRRTGSLGCSLREQA